MPISRALVFSLALHVSLAAFVWGFSSFFPHGGGVRPSPMKVKVSLVKRKAMPAVRAKNSETIQPLPVVKPATLPPKIVIEQKIKPVESRTVRRMPQPVSMVPAENKTAAENFDEAVSCSASGKTAGMISKEVLTLLVNQPPAYPRVARIHGWEGMVIVQAAVDGRGYVNRVDLISSSGYGILDSSAVKAVAKWRFKNVRSEFQVRIPIKYVLTEGRW
ncbi:MAG: TonB family protein [Candidatus Omnitrophica bacterium]|nr:TonB family protein [Candidatus Omnitrophota bacterium]